MHRLAWEWGLMAWGGGTSPRQSPPRPPLSGRTGHRKPALAADVCVQSPSLSVVLSFSAWSPGCPGARPLRGGRRLSISMGAPPSPGRQDPAEKGAQRLGLGGGF